MRYLVIMADTNDADYVYTYTKMDDSEYSLKIQSLVPRLVEVLQENDGEWCTTAERYDEVHYTEQYKNEFTEDEFDYLSEVIPYGDENYGISCIEEVYFMEKEQPIFNRR